MWIEEVKGSPFVKEIVEIAGKERIEKAAAEAKERGIHSGLARGLARGVVRDAVKHKMDLPSTPEETEVFLSSADEATLNAMLDDVENMTDFNEFVRAHCLILPSRTG